MFPQLIAGPIVKYRDVSDQLHVYKHRYNFKQKTAYEISACLVGSEMCIRDR